jgi:beta-lactamase class A
MKMKNKFLLIILIVILFLGFNIWAVFFYAPKVCVLSGNIQKSQNGFLNPARSIYKQENLIVNIQPLRDELNVIGSSTDISIYFEYLPTGANIAVNKDAEFFPASLLKLPVAIAVAKKIDEGKWQWKNELVLMGGDKDDKFGDLYKEPIGSVFTIEDLVKKSLAQSDNTAYRILLRNLEQGELENLQHHLGLDEFISNDGKISAKKYSVIIRSLYNSSYLSDDSSQKLLSFIAESKFDQYLAAGLPKDTIFAHKIGISDEQDVVLDSGIIFLPGRPYILSVMIKTHDIDGATYKMKDISQKVYDYINNYTEEK